MRNFRELNVWKDGRVLVKDTYTLTKLLPDSEKFGLIPQIQRSAISIPANIAEGCAKYSQKDFVRFLQVSLGSAYELESHIILCEDLNFISSNSAELIIKNIQKLQQGIASLIKYNRTNH
ncbi:four helix bundle protein [Flagellimonas alvinocaridis]|jgi:four helix bundle protein|uniref:Four helix bundle protein n=1 Tax=Flagellimonas alvinocaridis TaxID=2530200 RepID=A0A4S8RML9_9FLAO|nr:four helix bundle protein [Allomuricauda alvinocaridis]THV59300.1 four helix bundle protein [Allomuricauda alvinocaridis]